MFIDNNLEEQYGEQKYKEYLEKENKQLKEKNIMLKAYIEQLKQYIIIADIGEWFNLEELIKEEDDENESKSNRPA